MFVLMAIYSDSLSGGREMRTLILIAVAYVLANGAPVCAQSLTEQAQCAAQARTTAQEDNYKWEVDTKQMNLGMQTISFNYQSHYNKKLNRCLILTTREYTSDGALNVKKNLYDAFERRDYASYSRTMGFDKALVCQLIPTTAQTSYCGSREEFDAFVAGYMED
jgi:hypothetical protein